MTPEQLRYIDLCVELNRTRFDDPRSDTIAHELTTVLIQLSDRALRDAGAEVARRLTTPEAIAAALACARGDVTPRA